MNNLTRLKQYKEPLNDFKRIIQWVRGTNSHVLVSLSACLVIYVSQPYGQFSLGLTGVGLGARQVSFGLPQVSLVRTINVDQHRREKWIG